MRILPPISACLVASVLLAGCNFFDPALYQASELPPFPLADSCGPTVTVPSISETFVGIVDLSTQHDQFNDLGVCVDNQRTPGPDGFLSIAMQAGDKWHFHAKVLDTLGDPALYVLDTCDDRACQLGGGADICGSGEDEHCSFVAPRAGTCIIGIDDKGAGGGMYDLLAMHPTCGNIAAEHSEGCDDGNTDPGDGCDKGCRFELADGVVEHEPNDDFTGANRMPLVGGSGSATGLLEGRCDPDFYAVRVSEGGSVTAHMTNTAGTACSLASPVSVLELVGADGVNAIGAGVNPAGSGCPSIDGDAFTTGLPAGIYYIRITSPDVDTWLPYKLSVQVAGAP